MVSGELQERVTGPQERLPRRREATAANPRSAASPGTPGLTTVIARSLQVRRLVGVLVVGEPPVGFVCVELVDGIPLVWQLSVHPEHGRKGLGRALLRAACDWARAESFDAITLTTYRDVPWNGPSYESLDFATLDALPPGLQAIREHERAIGDDDFGPPVAMRLAL